MQVLFTIAVTVAPLVPRMDDSEAHSLYCCIIFKPVYAPHSKFYSSVLNKSMLELRKKKGMHP